MKKDIRSLTLEELKKEMTALGEPPHRARQIFSWLNSKNADSFRVMTDLPKKLIPELEKRYIIEELVCEERLKSKDGTEKFLWRLRDGEHIESVLISQKRRRTLCVSTQVGCRFKCPFCASGERGFKRNLSVSEITNQVLSAGKVCSCRISNIVFMGMGEPLDNYDNLVKAIRIINHPEGINIGSRKITVSTCGIIPGISKLKDVGLQIELSVSLHAADSALRDKLAPVNRKYPLQALVEACKEYSEYTGRIITLEYTLISGMNDSPKDAEKLAQIARDLKAKVNVIGYNPVSKKSAAKPSMKNIHTFMQRLKKRGVTVTLRRSRGDDIMAACGQLAATKRDRTAPPGAER
jgi:23S rRNA (adenine2503-C2)-methyltransferase